MSETLGPLEMEMLFPTLFLDSEPLVMPEERPTRLTQEQGLQQMVDEQTKSGTLLFGKTATLRKRLSDALKGNDNPLLGAFLSNDEARARLEIRRAIKDAFAAKGLPVDGTTGWRALMELVDVNWRDPRGGVGEIEEEDLFD